METEVSDDGSEHDEDSDGDDIEGLINDDVI